MDTSRAPDRSGGPRLSSTSRRYLIEFGTAMTAYFVVLVVSGFVVRAHPNAGWRYAVAATPLVPSAFALWAVVRHVGRVDELERRIQLEAITFGAVAAGLLTFGYGLLQQAGLPSVSYVCVLPLIITLWGAGVAVAKIRYR